MPSFSLRRAALADVPAILPLMEAFNAHELIPWRSGPMSAALREFLSDPSLGLGLVAQCDDGPGPAIAGYGLANFGYDIEFAGRDSFVTELFVAPAFRGQGLGRTLLGGLVSELRAAGVHAVHLMVRPENEQARALYESFDFELVPRLLMTKPL